MQENDGRGTYKKAAQIHFPVLGRCCLENNRRHDWRVIHSLPLRIRHKGEGNRLAKPRLKRPNSRKAWKWIWKLYAKHTIQLHELICMIYYQSYSSTSTTTLCLILGSSSDYTITSMYYWWFLNSYISFCLNSSYSWYTWFSFSIISIMLLTLVLSRILCIVVSPKFLRIRDRVSRRIMFMSWFPRPSVFERVYFNFCWMNMYTSSRFYTKVESKFFLMLAIC